MWQIITYEDDFMKVENYISWKYEMGIKKQFKSTLTDYIKSDI